MADILLTVGVDTSLSFVEFQSGITDIVSRVNANPPKIKVKFDDASINEMRQQIETLNKAVANSGGKGSMKFDTSGVSGSTAAVNANTQAKKANADASKKVASAAKEAASSESNFAAGTKKHTDALNKVNALLGQVTANTNKWTAASTGNSKKSYDALQSQIEKLKTLRDGLRDGSVSAEQFNNEFRQIKSIVTESSTAIKVAGENTKSFGDRIGGLANKFATWFGITRIIMATVRTCKQMVTASMEIEDSMAQLKIVTGASDSQMEAFLTKSTKLAKELGKSITDVSSSIETFSRLGYGLEDASELAKYANILSNVANVDVDTATTGMTSIIKGYNMDVSQAEHVSDVLVKVGQEYAISAEELMAAFQRGGAALYASGTDFEKSAALFAATNASLQNAESVGTMWKTVSARIRGAKTELEEMGEDTEGLADGLSKYREEIKSLSGVDIMIDDNTYKDMYDIFVELAQVWDNMKSDEARSRVAEILGGVRQLSGIMSTITNIRDAMGAYSSAMNSAGTATKANDIYMSTASAHLEQLKASFQELSATIIDSGFLVSVIDFGTNIIQILTSISQLINLLGGLNTVLKTTVGIIAIVKAESILSFFGSIGISISRLGEYTGLMFEIFQEGFAEAKSRGVSSLRAIGDGFKNVTGSISSAKLAVAGFVAALTAISLIKNYVQNSEQEEIDKARKEIETASAELDKAKAFKEAYSTYMQYVDKTNRTAAEEEKLNSAIETITQTMSGKTNALDGLTAKTEEYTEALKAQSQEESKQAYTQAVNKRVAAEKKLRTETWSIWDGSQITIDLSGRQGNKDFKSAYDLLKKMAPEYIDNGTWGEELEPINFDSNTDDMNAVVDYYYKLKEVQAELVMQKNTENDIYDESTNIINNLKDSVEEYTRAKYDEIASEYEMKKGIPSTIEEFKKYRDYLNKELGKEMDIPGLDSIIDSYLKTNSSYSEFLNSISQSPSIAENVSEIYKTASASMRGTAEDVAKSTEAIVSGITAVQSALSSQQNGKSFSITDFNSDELKEYRGALEYVNGTMQINADKAKEIAKAKADEQIKINNTNKALEQAKYLENAKQIEEYRKKIREKNYAEGESKKSIQDNINALLEENSTIADTCAQYDLLSASIQEAIGSYQHWLNAQNAADYGDMANDAVNAIQTIRDTYDENSDIFGNYGSKKFEAAIDFIVPDSVNKEDLGAIESYMASFKKYLTFDDDGVVEGLDIDKFLEKSVEKGLMSYSEDDGFKVLGDKKMEDFAEGLKMSSGMVQAFFDELQLKGADFDWSDEAVKTIGDLAIEANEAAESLRKLKDDEGNRYVIKMDVSDLETTKEQISELDATITKMDGIKAKFGIDTSEAEKANTIIQYCLTQKQLLTQPDVMRVDASKLKGDIRNAITLLQQFQEAQNDFDIKSKIGADTSDAESKITSLTTKIKALSPTIKASLDLDTTSKESIKTSISELSAETINVKAGIDASAIDGYQPETKSCDVIYNPKTDALPVSFKSIDRKVNYVPVTDSLPDRFSTITRYVRYVKVGSIGRHSLNGTAHLTGTARANGDWGTAPGGETLVGELG